MAFSNIRSLRVFLTGDTKGLEKALARADYKLKRFDKGAGGAAARGLGAGGFLGMGRGGLIAGGAGAAALGLKSVVDAASNAQVVLGQTSVAVNDAGLSWEEYGRRVQDASTRISKSSGFDDEKVMQSFAFFVRGQRDVEKSLQLASLAADVARGRYVDLDTATMLVNKAAMGQTGALRRAGIQIDKNATATQALAILQERYAGAAQTYANSAAGSADKLRVSFENLRETVGNALLPTVIQLNSAGAESSDFLSNLGVKSSDLASAFAKVSMVTPGFGPMIGELKLLNKVLSDSAQKMVELTSAARAAAEAIVAPGEGSLGRPNASTGRTRTRKQTVVTRVNARLEAALARAQRTTSTADDLGVLGQMKAFIEKALTQTNLNPSQRAALEQGLTSVVNEIQGIYDDQAQAAADARDEAKRKTAEAKQRQKERLQAALEAATTFADNLKQGALALLDRRQGKTDWQRALVDAKEQLRVAKLVGGPFGIRNAQRALADADLARQRWMLESANVKPLNGSSAQIVMNGVTVVANNPRELVEAVAKAAKRNASQARGRNAGSRTFFAGA